MRHWRSILAGIAVFISLCGTASMVTSRLNGNCDRIHRLVGTLDTMIANSDAQIDKYEREGLLTAAQAVRARHEQAENRRLLAGADCH